VWKGKERGGIVREKSERETKCWIGQTRNGIRLEKGQEGMEEGIEERIGRIKTYANQHEWPR
jgi:hypothetical protein